VGIDVHKKKWVTTIRAHGMELRTFSMNPSPKELADHLHRNYPEGIFKTAYEAGFCDFWIHHQLESLGLSNCVIHAADIPTTNKEKVHKRDQIDSRKLARELEKGELNALYVPQIEQQQLRSLCRLRQKCTQQGTRLKNRIKGHLHYYGIVLPKGEVSRYWSAAFISELESYCTKKTAGSSCLRFLIQELKEQRRRLSDITCELRTFCKRSGFSDMINCLRTVPGLGFITIVTLITEIIDINRFNKFDNLCSFVGLVPSTSSSGEKERINGLTPRRNKYLKHLIIESAWVAARKDPELLQAFSLLIKRMPKTDAIIRIARKLLNRIRYVWKNQTPYKTTLQS